MDRMKCALEIQKWYVLLDPKKAMRTLKFREEDRHQKAKILPLGGCDVKRRSRLAHKKSTQRTIIPKK